MRGALDEEPPKFFSILGELTGLMESQDSACIGDFMINTMKKTLKFSKFSAFQKIKMLSDAHFRECYVSFSALISWWLIKNACSGSETLPQKKVETLHNFTQRNSIGPYPSNSDTMPTPKPLFFYVQTSSLRCLLAFCYGRSWLRQ